jgi:hypothetical protein
MVWCAHARCAPGARRARAYARRQVKVKMSCEGFLKNNRGINDGADLPPDFMRALYERIVHNEIKVRRVGWVISDSPGIVTHQQ